MENNDNTVYVLDAYGLIYRAYFALVNHPLTNKNGENISAVVIFFKNLKALLSKYKPNYLAAAFDSCTPTFRHKMYSEYKATRMKTPDDLHAQVPWIEDVLNSLNIPVLRLDGYEADDIIATIATKCKAQNRGCRILSADKDLLQLVDENCHSMQPDKESGGWAELDVEAVIQKWGLPPSQILDYLSLTGDSADNVPGVKGVGDKTALKLLNQYETLDGIYAHADEIAGALGNKIRGDKENAYFSKKLITLCTDVPVDINFDSFTTSDMDWKKGGEALLSYGAMQAAQDFLKEVGLTTKDVNVSLKKKDAPKENFTPELQQSLFDFSAPEESESQIELPFSPQPENIVQNKGNYSSCTKLVELSAFIDSILLSQTKTVAFDTETDGLNTMEASLVGFSLSRTKGEAIYVPVILPGEMFAPPTISKEDCIKELSRLFLNKDVTIVMHNAKFDLQVLNTAGLKETPQCRIADTMIAYWILNPSADGKNPYALETLGEKLLGLKGIEFNDIVPKGQTFKDIDLETATPYAAEDADFTLQIYCILMEEINKRNFTSLYWDLEMKVLPILSEMETNGIHLNKDALNEFSAQLETLIGEKEKQIYEFAGHQFNIASTKQLQTVLFEEQGLKTGKKTKTGYSTDTAVLEELAETTDNPIPKAILDYRSYTKLKSTYVDTLPLLADNNSRIHTSFLQTGTATGRLSSRDPNLQNIPVRDDNGRRIRSAFTAIPGTVLISADYAQIELVVLAHLSGDKNLCNAFNSGTDVHKSTAALIYGVAMDQVTPEMRRTAKTINFGVMYGMSAFSLAKDLGISRTQAQQFMNGYFTTYAAVKNYLDQNIQTAKAKGYVESITGRRRYIPEINNKNKIIQNAAERVVRNTPIQGSAADIVKTAMVKVNDELKKQLPEVKMLLQVHDELIFECPDAPETIEKAVSIIKEQMESAYKLNVPLKVSIEYGKSWGEFH